MLVGLAAVGGVVIWVGGRMVGNPQAAAGPVHDPPVLDGAVAEGGSGRAGYAGSGPEFGFVGVLKQVQSPADPSLAVGVDHVAMIGNGSIAFFQKDGTLLEEHVLGGPGGFWQGTGVSVFPFDPEITYDPWSDRFFALCISQTFLGHWHLAVSDDGDPTGAWHKYTVQGLPAGWGAIDSPNLAVDEGAVYVTADYPSAQKQVLWIVAKAPLLNGGSVVARTLLIPVTRVGLAGNGSLDSAQYMLEGLLGQAGNQVRVHAIVDPLQKPVRHAIDVPVPIYRAPERPPQKGTSKRPETFDARFWSCMVQGGSLWATHHVGTKRVRQRWYEIDLRGWPASGATPALAQWGEIDLGPGVRTYFGAIWTDRWGNTVLVFAHSSPATYISMARAWRRASDPLGTLRPALTLRTSTGPDKTQRWGDYAGIAPDPSAPGAFWVAHQFRDGPWKTWVGLTGPCAPPETYCTPKLTSTGAAPQAGWSGEPSVGQHTFAVTLAGGLPRAPATLLSSDRAIPAPFQDGALCLARPVRRAALLQLDGHGAASVPVALSVDELGRTRYWQFRFRDPQHPDGTGIGLSDAVAATVCP